MENTGQGKESGGDLLTDIRRAVASIPGDAGVPGIVETLGADHDSEPAPGELWHTGAEETPLVYVVAVDRTSPKSSPLEVVPVLDDPVLAFPGDIIFPEYVFGQGVAFATSLSFGLMPDDLIRPFARLPEDWTALTQSVVQLPETEIVNGLIILEGDVRVTTGKPPVSANEWRSLQRKALVEKIEILQENYIAWLVESGVWASEPAAAPEAKTTDSQEWLRFVKEQAAFLSELIYTVFPVAQPVGAADPGTLYSSGYVGLPLNAGGEIEGKFSLAVVDGPEADESDATKAFVQWRVLQIPEMPDLRGSVFAVFNPETREVLGQGAVDSHEGVYATLVDGKLSAFEPFRSRMDKLALLFAVQKETGQ